MASNNIKPKSPPASPLTSPKGKGGANTKKENELKLKEAKARKKEAQKDLSRAKEQLAQTNGSLKATDEEVAKLESNLALQERNLRERDRSLQYLTEMLSASSSSSRIGGNELLNSVFGKLARLGSGKKKTSSSKANKTDKKAAAAHQHRPHGPEDVDADSESESDDHSEVEEKQKITAAAASATTGSAVVAASSQTSTPRDKPKNESVASGIEEEEEDDGGYFVFDLRSKVRCTLAGPRNLCAWEEFNHLSSTLRYFRNFKAHEVAELFVLVPATPIPVGSSVQEEPQPSGLAGLMASIQQRTRAPLALIQKIFARIEKTVGQPKTCTCVFIGLVSVAQAATSAEKEALLYDAITGKGSEGKLTLDTARELFHYRFRFVEAVVRASLAVVATATGREEKEVKRGLKKLFGQAQHARDQDKPWNRAAASVFQFIEKQRARARRTCIDDEDDDNDSSQQTSANRPTTMMMVTRREWTDAMQYVAHFFHAPSAKLFRGDGPDEIGEAASADEGDGSEVEAEAEARPPSSSSTAGGPTGGSTGAKQLPRAGESGESAGDCETDNEEYYLSDYEIEEDDDEDEEEDGKKHEKKREATKRRRADWEVDHGDEVATFIGGLNAYLRPAAFSCRTVWAHVLSFVDVRSLLAGVSLVSRRFHALVSEPKLWRHLLLGHYAAASRHGITTNLHADDAEQGWRRTFFTHHWLAHSKRVRFCLIGHVASGKSTLLGRILQLLGCISPQEVERCREQAELNLRLVKALHWSARDCTLPSGREIELVSVPGRLRKFQNAVTGASTADVAILVVSAALGKFEAGMVDDVYPGGTRAHLILAKRLGLSRVIVVVNGMDSYVANYKQGRYREIEDAVLKLAAEVGYQPEALVMVPISAWASENVLTPSPFLAWWPRASPPALCVAGAPKGEEVVVKALVRSGMVREGQVLHARLQAPIANPARVGPQPASALVTLAVVSIRRF